MGAAHRWCLRAAVFAGAVTAFVGMLLPGCQFPNYSLPGGNAGLPQGGGGSGVAGSNEGGRSGGAAAGADGGAGEGAEGGGRNEPCPPDACTDGPPSGWQGPVAFWEQASGTEAPECPPGYTDATDLHRGLVAPMPSCKCTCEPEGQSCDPDTTLNIYYDKSCETDPPCASVTLAGCTQISTCTGSQGSLKADIPMPTGGSCVPKVPPPVTPTWEFDARICRASDVQICDDPNQVCAPTPPSPYQPVWCVMRAAPAGDPRPVCPAGFPVAQPILYDAVADDRGCTKCVCSSLSGGECAGSLTISSNGDCNGTTTTTYKLGDGCKPFDLGGGNNVFPRSVKGTYTLTPGACSVTMPSEPKGEAVEGGMATFVCCQ